MTRQVHIVGSVPLANAATVFETLGQTLGALAPRLPDGETGARLNWITWLEPQFKDNPAFVATDQEYRVHAQATAMRRYKLKPGATPKFDDLGIAGIARGSYAAFKAAKAAGKVPATTKFQLDIAPAHTLVRAFVDEADQAKVEPIYDDAIKREIAKVAQIVPHAELAIQFDVASAVFFLLESGKPTRYGKTKDEMQAAFAAQMIALGNAVPPDVDLIYHLCYGDNQHKHSIEPTDTADMVELANRISRGIGRSIQLFHMPVPRNRSDDAYFAPLRNLGLHPETRLSLGLVHHTDGLAGTKARIAAADKVVKDFMIATECGFGRRDPKTIPELLRIHAEAAKA
jgi:methionine synthase II (cobalamin-independent)